MSDGPHPLLARVHRSRAAHRRRSRLYRAVFAVAGVLVTLAGCALLVLPGPAFAIIPLGLFMLAMEFAWAERLLERAVVRAEAARATARSTSAAQRALALMAVAVAAVGVATAAVLWDIPVLPV